MTTVIEKCWRKKCGAGEEACRTTSSMTSITPALRDIYFSTNEKNLKNVKKL